MCNILYYSHLANDKETFKLIYPYTWRIRLYLAKKGNKDSYLLKEH